MTKNRLKPIESGEILELSVKGWAFLLEQSLDYNLLHVVVQNFFRVAVRVPKCVRVAADERVGAHVCHELYVSHP